MAATQSVRLQKPHFAVPIAKPLSNEELKERKELAAEIFWRPKDKKNLRACLHCKIINTADA